MGYIPPKSSFMEKMMILQRRKGVSSKIWDMTKLICLFALIIQLKGPATLAHIQPSSSSFNCGTRFRTQMTINKRNV